ncbi:uncharacterized protein BCR38DRAFT_481334 [Pseudomassariella vexata]|uniref:Uncharacterized protein n=1 Tax=Pseudomassariella vexata TaxID=1141098 RepID=A0A1Y2EF44_9PEZI|nr:uncharacterized protein BCR38DRAFT_481334 [Pseudomassariella vexata]ORY70190.1 hypothetical protein BCR38DRAFT_481334 [Pseudomassariella vexata]
MANISLDSQSFYTAAGPTPTSRNPAFLSVGYSRDDALVISSSDESEYGHVDDSQSDTSKAQALNAIQNASLALFGKLQQPTGHGFVEVRSVNSIDSGFNAASAANANNNVEKPSVGEGSGVDVDPDDQDGTEAEQQADGRDGCLRHDSMRLEDEDVHHSAKGNESEKDEEDDDNFRPPPPKFGEWPLKDAILKRVTMHELATFQLQFIWDLTNYRYEDYA